MEDKWIAYVEDDRLFMHRSWTGHCIYEAQFEECEGGWHVTSAVVTDDRNVYGRGSDEYESLFLEALLDLVFFGKRADFWERLYDLRKQPPPRQE
jgi:hypothetical protein